MSDPTHDDWHPPIPDDYVPMPIGQYAVINGSCDGLPEHLAVFTVGMPWQDKEFSCWFLAAGNWGPAPYAMIFCRASHVAIPMGDWTEVVENHRQAIEWVHAKSAALSLHGVCQDSGLMLLRSALALEKNDTDQWGNLVQNVLLRERALDKKNEAQKKSDFLARYPEFEIDMARIKKELNSAMDEKINDVFRREN